MLVFPEGMLLILAQPRSLRIERVAAEPLLALETRLVSHSLSAEEIRGFPPESLVRRGGEAWISRRLADGRNEDPATWLELSASFGLASHSLGRPPSAPSPAFAPPADARRTLGIAEAAPEGVSLMARLQAKHPPGFFSRWLAGPERRKGKNGSVSLGVASALPAHDGGTSWLTKWIRIVGVWQWVGWRHARYLRELFRSLEGHDYDEVLRRALPLSSSPLSGEGAPSLSPPGLRSELRITSGKGAASLFLDEGLFLGLGQHYRQMAKVLEGRGEIEKAAFVLTELLGSPTEAIGLLERHKLFRQAAEIAEIRQLEPSVAVRLHFLAGNVERAVALALAFDVFASSVQMLETKGGQEAAAKLRRAWATRLVTAGDFVAAVRVLRPIEQSEHEILPLLEQGLRTACFLTRGELLIHLSSVATDRQSEILAEWRQLLAARDENAFELRCALAELLVGSTPGWPLAGLAQASLRALLEDGDRPDLRRLRKKLLEMADDRALQEELHHLQLPQHRPRPVVLPLQTCAAPEMGGLEIRDLAVLPGNRLLLAAGNLGVFLLGADGKVYHHFDQPADQLALADHGQQAIGIAYSGRARRGYARLFRLDLHRLRGEAWTEGELEAAASDYDGQRFVIARERTLEVLDAVGPGCRMLWRLPNLDGEVLQISRNGENICFAVQGPLRIWRLDRNLVLRAKDDIELLPDPPEFPVRSFAIDPTGQCGLLVDAPQIFLRRIRGEARLGDLLLEATTESIAIFGPYLVIEKALPASRLCQVLSLEPSALYQEVASIEMPGCGSLSPRIFGHFLAVWDEQGRWLLADLEKARVRAAGRFCG